MKLWMIAAAGVMLTPLVAFAQQDANSVLPRWSQFIGKNVSLNGCFLTWATKNNMYCDAKPSEQRLYVDTATFDPADLATAISSCYDYQLRPECAVTLNGQMQASYGSPLLVNGRAQFAGAADAPDTIAAEELPAGEYACTGSGGRILVGLGFVADGKGGYTDLDRQTFGQYAVSGTKITFSGGHLGGQTGRDLSPSGSFVLGRMVSCGPW